MLDNSPEETEVRPALKPVLRIKFDRWLFEMGLDNVTAAKLLGVHPMSIGRWRKPFDDQARPIPPTRTIRDVERISAGVVRFEDWDRPCEVAYITPASETDAAQ